MASFGEWWGGLQMLNQWFFMAAAFFSVFFAWQILSALLGMGGEHDLDTHPDQPMEHQVTHDADDTITAFRLISVRSILAFLTLFSWAGALYLNRGTAVPRAMLYAMLWGAVAMILVSTLVHFLRRMTETGNVRIATAVGADGTVYLDIPAGGDGEIRVLCSGVMTHLKARAPSGAAIKAGGQVKVLAVTGPNSVDVELCG